jgi:hypothetical protein
MAGRQYVELALPPGVFANGTARESGSDGPDGPRWRLSNLVRWPNATDMQPVGGWQVHSASAPALTGVARSITTWSDLAALRWIAVGTPSHLYVMTASGALTDITPVGFTAGLQDAVTGAGFGQDAFGIGGFGQPGPDASTIQPATVWDLKPFGQRLLGCTVDDGKLYVWANVPANPATQIPAAPTNLTGMHVTANEFVFAFQQKTVNWCDVGDYTTWSPTSTNQAGNAPLNTDGTFTCGASIRGGELLFTNTDVWLAVYSTNAAIVWTFTKLQHGCGAISKKSPVVFPQGCVWMATDGFYIYNGYLNPLNCDVAGYVFDNINQTQISKVQGFHNAYNNEVWWLYPSAASIEIDSYVFWDYRWNYWAVGQISRTAACEPGVFTVPFMVGTDGLIYEHEVGWNVGGVYPYARSGPIEMDDPDKGPGGRVVQILNMIPDEKTLGDSQVTLYARFYPNGTETAYGPFPTRANQNQPTNILAMGRQMEAMIQFTGADDARAGLYRFEVQPRGRR